MQNISAWVSTFSAFRRAKKITSKFESKKKGIRRLTVPNFVYFFFKSSFWGKNYKNHQNIFKYNKRLKHLNVLWYNFFVLGVVQNFEFGFWPSIKAKKMVPKRNFWLETNFFNILFSVINMNL